MHDFNTLKKNRQQITESLTRELESLNSKNPQADDKDMFWSPTVDKAGNGQAAIRFLPPPQGENKPFIRFWDHGFQGPGGWYIEKSLTTLGQPDPLSELNTRLWNTGNEADKELVRKQKRRLHYVSNIYVIKDPGNPDNEGKVFLFKYGKKIFDKIHDIMNPSFDGEEKVNPFDLWEGANFKLRIRNYEGYRNYDKSEFDRVGPLLNDDEQLEKIWKQQHSLQAFLDPKNFKTYEELKKRLDRALGVASASSQQRQSTGKTDSRDNPPWVSDDDEDTTTTSKDDDEDMSFFKRLAQD